MVARDIPELSRSVLADLHADNLPPDLQRRLWPIVRRDPAAQHTIDALDRVCAELRDLNSRNDAPDVPADVTARLATAIDDATHRRVSGRSGRPIRVAAAVAASVLGTLALLAAALTLRTEAATDTVRAQTPSTDLDRPPTAMLGALGRSALGHRDISGPLADPVTRDRCLAANGVDRPLLGAMNVTLDQRNAVLLVVPGERPGQIIALAVGSGCAPGNPELLARQEIN